MLFPFVDACPHCQRAIFFLSSFAQYAQDVPDSEQSSDNGSVSNSDAEPEMQDSEVEMQEDNIWETVDNVVPENQEFGRIGPSKDTAIVSRQYINLNKYNIIIHVIIICSYMPLHVLVWVGCLSLCWYNIGEDLGLEWPSSYVSTVLMSSGDLDMH